MVWENHLQHPFQLWYSILDPVLELLKASIPACFFFYFAQERSCQIWSELLPSKCTIGLPIEGRKSKGEPILVMYQTALKNC